ncbi:MAG: transposase family protein [Chloroflexi bacterium]|nr:transposase family protein [Chloroflexota bacterium]
MKDHRRKQGIRYQQGHILLFTILAILSGATSYRKVRQFLGHEEVDVKTNEIGRYFKPKPKLGRTTMKFLIISRHAKFCSQYSTEKQC